MENSPYSIYCHNPGNPYYRLTCNQSDLMPVKTLEEQYDSDNVCTGKVAIHRCRVCGGFYKQEYRATYSEDGWMGDDDGWIIEDHYYKIEEPGGDARTSTIPLTIEDARTFGYTGEDFTWANNRCNFDLRNVELTCRMRDLQFMGWLLPALRAHNDERFYQCNRCGEWYLFKILPVYTEAYLKPASEHFTIETARLFGYDEKEIPKILQSNLPSEPVKYLMKGQVVSSLAEAWNDPEKLPAFSEWLKVKRGEAARAQYAYIIMKKHFARNGVELKKNEVPHHWWEFGTDLDWNIRLFVSNQEHSEMLKAMFVEIVDFCEAFSGEYFFASNLVEILKNFIDRELPFSLISPLLPAKALVRLDEMNTILARIWKPRNR